MMSSDIKHIKMAFKNKSAKIGVIGLGYVGLPLIMAFINKNFQVYGFDIDKKKIDDLNSGRSYIKQISSKTIMNCVLSKQFRPTSDFSQISSVDAIIICVPTPLKEKREPDLSYIVSTGEMILPHIKPNQIIILESTTYPGTSTEILKPILEKNGLKSGEDIFLAYSPEREDPGNPSFGTASIPKIVGGDGNDARDLACLIYDQVVIETVPVSSMEVAEAVKLTENIFRAVNIAMVNELKIIFDKMDIDIWEVIKASSTKPFGFMPFYPGPGLGGHCIPIDPFYLTWKAKQFGVSAPLINIAGDVNVSMPDYVMQKISFALRQSEKTITGSNILLLGLAYKKNVDDDRESVTFKIMEMLEKQGAKTDYNDPYIPIIKPRREYKQFIGKKSIALEQLSFYDLTIILTDHSTYDYGYIVKNSKLVVDTRNACDNIKSEKIIKA